MKSMNRWLWAGWAALLGVSACSGHRSFHASQPSRASEAGEPTMAIATGCAPLPDAPTDFTFQPQPHPPRVHARFVPPPPLDSLPRMVQNAGCTPSGRALEGLAHARPTPPPRVGGRRPPRGPVATYPAPNKDANRGESKASSAPGSGAGPRPADATSTATAAPPAGRYTAGGAAAPPPAAKRPPASPAPDNFPQPSAPASEAEYSAPSAAMEPSGADDDRGMPEPLVTEPFAPPAPCPAPPAPPPPDATDSYSDWGVATYLSNDDTMSLSSAQRIVYAIDKYQPLPPQHLRRHELLNYFSFDTAPVQAGNDFSVSGSLAPKDGDPNVVTLALAVRGRSIDAASRRNLALTVLVDRSGSMRDEGRMSFLKRGLRRMLRELRPGDMVNLVTFNTSACIPLENFVVGRDRIETLEKAIDGIQPQGNTDLQTGLLRAYQVADAQYRAGYNHRVLLITDALANTGDTDPELMSIVSRFYDARQIRLSGIGVGREFNDRLLDRLTERGKGAYVFLGSDAEVDAVFGSRFVSLVETTALDTHFLLHLPPSLRMNVFYGEESSTSRAEVQPIHYFAGTSQLFLSDLMTRHGQLRDNDMVMLGIEYRDPDSGESRLEEHALRLGDLLGSQRNVKKAQLVVEFVDGLGWMASRVPQGRAARAERRGWIDDDAAWECQQRGQRLDELARPLAGDPEVRRISGLWSRYCERFEPPRGPRRTSGQGPETWPGAVVPD